MLLGATGSDFQNCAFRKKKKKNSLDQFDV